MKLERVERAIKHSIAMYTGSLLGYSWLCAIQSVSLYTRCSLRGLPLHNLRSEIFSSNPNSLCFCQEVNSYTFRKSVVVLLFCMSEYFCHLNTSFIFHSGGLSKISYLVRYLWFLCVFLLLVVWQWTKCFVMCQRRCCLVNRSKKVISLTGVCSSHVVAALRFVGVDVVGGSKLNSILVLAKAVLTLSVVSPTCFLLP